MKNILQNLFQKHEKKAVAIAVAVLLLISNFTPVHASAVGDSDMEAVPAVSETEETSDEAGQTEAEPEDTKPNEAGQTEAEPDDTKPNEAGTAEAEQGEAKPNNDSIAAGKNAAVIPNISEEETEEAEEQAANQAEPKDTAETTDVQTLDGIDSEGVFSMEEDNIFLLAAGGSVTVTETDNLYLQTMSASDMAELGSLAPSDYVLSNGYVAFSFKINQTSTEGKNFVQKLNGSTASNQDFWSWCPDAYDGGSWYSWSSRYKYLHNELLLCAYYGYPYNSSGTDFLTRAVNTYGISEELAQDAVRLATQLAIWSITDETDFTALDYLRNTDNSSYKSYYDPVFCLAGEIAAKAYNASYSAPSIIEDLYREDVSDSDSSGVLLLATRATEPAKTQITPAVITPAAKVVLNGANLSEGEFSFSLKDSDGNTIETVSNDADGNITFSPISYQVSGTRAYTIEENDTAVAGITLDTDVHTMTVNVTGTYTKTAAVTYDGSTDVPVFTNTTALLGNTSSGENTVVITATKMLDGGAPGDKRFTFILYDENDQEIERVQNDSNGNITFSPISYNGDGTYTYTIRELNDNQTGIEYDTKALTATVSVNSSSSGLDGQTVYGNYHDYPDNNDYYYMMDKTTGFEYKVYCLNDQLSNPYGNDYYATQDVSNSSIRDSLTVKDDESVQKIKKLLYYFALYPDEYKAFEQQKMIWEVSGVNKGMSSDITRILTEVTEVPDNFHTVFFTNGNSKYQNLITGYIVSDPTVTLTADGDAASAFFENTTVEPKSSKSVSVTITANKTLDGKAPGDKRFTFILYDANGTEISRAQNDSNGTITFDPINYTQAGTYTYTIRELDDNQSGIIYDTKSIKATITVTEVVSELDGVDFQGFEKAYNSSSVVDHYYMTDSSGNSYTVFCLNGDLKSPKNQSFIASQDEDDSVLEAALTTPNAANLERVKKCLYYFLLYPSTYSQAQQQRIIWKASGWGSSSTYETIVQNICNQITTIPDNFHTVYFDSGDSDYQNLIYAYLAPEPTVTLSADSTTEKAVFANLTEPTTVMLPDTGGSGTKIFILFGPALMACAFVCGYIKFKFINLKGE